MKTRLHIPTIVLSGLITAIMFPGSYAQQSKGLSDLKPGLKTLRDLEGDMPIYLKYLMKKTKTASTVAITENSDGTKDIVEDETPGYTFSKRRVAKIDLDADLNYDGTISNTDPSDGGIFEHTPPGLVVGQGELSKCILRIRPHRLDYEGQIVVTMEVSPINRTHKSGTFANQKDELKAAGRVRVWRDAEKTKLLLDSSDPAKRIQEFVFGNSAHLPNVPNVVPRIVYVEGLKPSPEYKGDIRFLTAVSHRQSARLEDLLDAETNKKVPPPEAAGSDTEEKEAKTFTFMQTAYDHLLLTVVEKPLKKEFVNNNAEAVWITPK